MLRPGQHSVLSGLCATSPLARRQLAVLELAVCEPSCLRIVRWLPQGVRNGDCRVDVYPRGELLTFAASNCGWPSILSFGGNLRRATENLWHMMTFGGSGCHTGQVLRRFAGLLSGVLRLYPHYVLTAWVRPTTVVQQESAG